MTPPLVVIVWLSTGIPIPLNGAVAERFNLEQGDTVPDDLVEEVCRANMEFSRERIRELNAEKARRN